jgi:D-amino-acid dehydrogenase
MSPYRADVIVVGAGVVGLSVAYFAALRGAEVIVLEKGEIGSGSSSGNAGLVVPSYFEPLPGPGMIREGLRGMLDPEGFFAIRPRFDPALYHWLFRFAKFCGKKYFESSIGIIRKLNAEALKIHLELAQIGGREYDFSQRGLLFLYLNPKRMAEAKEKAARASEMGLSTEVFSREQIHSVEPLTGEEVTGGIRYFSDAGLNPALFLKWLWKQASAHGAKMITQCDVYGFVAGKGSRLNALLTTKGEFQADQVILATGAWTALLGRHLGIRIPIEGGKGISQTFCNSGINLPQPLILGEHHVAVSPLANALRVTGLLELAGTDLTISPRRVGGIRQAAGRYIPVIGKMKPDEVWRGLRPCTPDGLPLIGRLKNWRNVIVAGGHDTKGMTLGPLTGIYVDRLLSGQPLPDFAKPLGPERFSI